jgi:hypothetical protein
MLILGSKSATLSSTLFVGSLYAAFFRSSPLTPDSEDNSRSNAE